MEVQYINVPFYSGDHTPYRYSVDVVKGNTEFAWQIRLDIAGQKIIKLEGRRTETIQIEKQKEKND